MQFLHLHTKFASPRLPDISFDSCVTLVEAWISAIWREEVRHSTYKTAHADPIWVGLATGSTLDFEGVVVWGVTGVLRGEVSDPVFESALLKVVWKLHGWLAL